MVLFLSSFLLLYSLLNAYLFVRARNALQFGPWVAIPLVIFLLLMIVAPIMVQLSEHAGLTWLARVLYVVGFTWLGLLFLFVCMTLVVDAGRLVVYAAGKMSGINLSILTHYGKTYFLTSLFLIAAIGAYGVFEARAIRSEHITLHTSRLPAGTRPIRNRSIWPRGSPGRACSASWRRSAPSRPARRWPVRSKKRGTAGPWDRRPTARSGNRRTRSNETP
jgi:hypothetical protein